MEIRIPEVGESVREALLAKWFKQNGDPVVKDEPLCEIETDKITLDLNADASGILTILKGEGATVAIGSVIGTIEVTGESLLPPLVEAHAEVRGRLDAPASSPSVRREMREHELTPDEVTGSGKGGRITLNDLFTKIEERAKQPPASRPAEPFPPVVAAPAVSIPRPVVTPVAPEAPPVVAPVYAASIPVTPAPVDVPELAGSVRSEDAVSYSPAREERRPISPIRRRISERLVQVRQQTAMLTTFNEADMTAVNLLRQRLQEQYLQAYGFKPGYMPFFVAACCRALKEFPAVNARIDANDQIFHHYCDIGIAIGGDKGLVVPVLRSAEAMQLHEIDAAIKEFSHKVATNRLAISDLEGGTFSISNGGVYGSMLSTPILNPPQSAVLGMHAIQDRPVARDGQVVIRPMMYLALSYDHRIIDGREAVSFLKRVIELLEQPESLVEAG